MKNKTIGERMKEYESEWIQKLNPNLPIIARIDGKTFHTFTRNMPKPYSFKLLNAFQKTTKFLCESFNCDLGYCQSDEISLLWLKPQNLLWDGKVAKYNSILASYTTAYFNQMEWDDLAFFDCRVNNLPDWAEVKNYFIWRERDCIKNAITLAASQYYSHKQLLNKNSQNKIEMLSEKNIRFPEDYLGAFVRGSYVKKFQVEKENEYGKFYRGVHEIIYNFPNISFKNFEEYLISENDTPEE